MKTSKNPARISGYGFRRLLSTLRRCSVQALALSTLALATVRAQAPSPQPPAPSDTVFPLGGLVTAINTSLASSYFPVFGLNMFYGGFPGINGVSTDLNYFFPSGTNASGPAGGWNPLFAQLDFNLASNEIGAAAWDLAPAQTSNSNGAWWETTALPKMVNNALPNNEYYITKTSTTFNIRPTTLIRTIQIFIISGTSTRIKTAMKLSMLERFVALWQR